MATLMEDPVILPSSRVTIDRGTIKTHLLSNPMDPFNRSLLKIEDVIPSTIWHSSCITYHLLSIVLHANYSPPDVELKAQIEAFKLERRRVTRIDAMELNPQI